MVKRSKQRRDLARQEHPKSCHACEDKTDICAIEFEETMVDIVKDDFIQCLPYLRTGCVVFCGQDSQLSHWIRV